MSFDNGMFQCDECPEFIDTEEEDFPAALTKAKAEGWRTYKKGKEWAHSCPACVKAFAQQQRDEDYDRSR